MQNAGSEQIAQSTSSVGVENTITISLQSTVGIQSLPGISGAFTISGLASGFAGSSRPVPVTNQGYNSIEGLFVGNSATWDKPAGKLVFQIDEGQHLGAGKLYVFSVALNNPGSAQASPDITLEISGAPGQVVAMKKASGSSAPLLVEAPTFKVLRIGQKYSGAAVPNEITVTLKPNLKLSRLTTFFIEGLIGSGTSDSVELPVSGCDGVFEFQKPNVGRWSQSSGTLELKAAKDILDASTVVCTFGLINPAAPQAAAEVSITVKSTAAGQISNLIGPETFRNAPGQRSPFMVSPATFLEAKIIQSAPYPGEQENRITVSLQSSVAVGSAGGIVSSITITGLTGSETSDTRSLPLSGSFATSVESTAVWTKSSGTLIMTISDSKTMEANKPYTISFVLANPSQEQDSPAVSISSSGGQAINVMAMNRDTKSCIHNEGDVAPLFVYPRGFLKKAIGMRATWPQASNLLSVTLQSSVSISSLPTAQTLISITGLKFASNSDPAIPITSSAPSLFGTTAEFNSDEGSLVVKILPSGQEEVMQAGKEYQINVLVENTAQETLFAPQITVTGPVNIGVSEMTYGGGDSPVQVTFTTSAPKVDVGMTLSFTARSQILKSDSIIVLLPGFSGTSTKAEHQIWGVTSDPPAFEIQGSDVEYGDAMAGGSAVAEAKYRAGVVSRTQVAAEDTDGEKGSTIVLDLADARVLGTSNVYAGMQISIEGSGSYHSIYQQRASAPQQPAVAHFFPKYNYGANQASAVPAGAMYAIVSQIELTSKENICAGTKISITVPGGSGIISPPGGIQDDTKIMLSHVKMGNAQAAIGTPDTIAAGMVPSSTHITVTLDDTRPTYFGLPWAPVRMPPLSNAVFIDGFRTIVESNETANKVTLMTGYGPMRKTRLSSDAAVEMKGAKLNHMKNVEQNSEWLTLSSVASMSPALVEGSYLQLEDEILQYTGIKAAAVQSITAPQTRGSGCKDRNGAACGANGECASISASNCKDAPLTTVLFSDGAVQGFALRYGGACPEVTSSKFEITLADGVSCETDPSCGAGCLGSLTAERNVIKVQRAQFSSVATELKTCETTKCENIVKPSSVYVESNGLSSLLYTSSINELNHAKEQSVKIGYKQIVDTVVAGNVTSITIPQTTGTNCRVVSDGAAGALCTGSGCASVLFSGCSINPEASPTFTNGVITAVEVKSGGICQAGEVLVGNIVVGSKTECTQDPACGTGCKSSLGTSRDVLIIKHRPVDKTSDITHEPGDEVVRVHPVESNIGYKIVMVPPTLCAVGVGKSTNLSALSPGQCAPAPKAGSVVSWIDPETGDVLASMYAVEDGLLSLCLDFTSDNDKPYYPPACAESCDNRTADGNYVASKPVNISLQYEGNRTSIGVVLTMPITFNTARGRRAAPKGGEFRLNGDCKCPSSKDSFVNCTIQSSGVYQAHLMEDSKCANDSVNVLALVLGVTAGLVVLLACGYAYYTRRAPKAEPVQKEVEPEEGGDGYEGPVFVGRPVPLTPTMQPLAVFPPNISPAPINISVSGGAPEHANRSPVLAADAAGWNNSNSYVGSLPATLTPAARPGSSPRLSMLSSGVPPNPSEFPSRGRDEGLSMSSPRQRSVSPDSRRSPPRSARVPYGV